MYVLTNKTDTLNSFAAEHLKLVGSSIGNDVLEAGHQPVVVHDKVFLHSVGDGRDCCYDLFKHEFCATFHQL